MTENNNYQAQKVIFLDFYWVMINGKIKRK